MLTINSDDPLAVAVAEAIHAGDVEGLKRLLRDHPGLATARLVGRGGGDEGCEVDEAARTLLHVAADWPGHFPNGAGIVAALVDAGADVNARFVSERLQSTETPLHWAASSDDVEVLDALLDTGADIEAPGAVIAGGTPLDDAVAFGQWRTARRLVERGARTALWHAAALGLMDRVDAHFAKDPPPSSDEITEAFWHACRGYRQAAEYLLDRGADLDWVSDWDGLTPLDAAVREGADEVVAWLRARGARLASDLG